LEEAIEWMRSHHIKRLPVVAEGRIVGILSRANVLAALVRRI
jgi:CBS domain-containing protein